MTKIKFIIEGLDKDNNVIVELFTYSEDKIEKFKDDILKNEGVVDSKVLYF